MTYYSIDDLAIMTGLTTRTLRSYIKSGVLHGEKADGRWQFTDDDFGAFLNDAAARRAMRARRNALVSDFLADTAKAEDAACVILDFAVSDAEGERIARHFCDGVNRLGGVEFCYSRRRGMSRVILTGERERVAELVCGYARPADRKEETT